MLIALGSIAVNYKTSILYSILGVCKEELYISEEISEIFASWWQDDQISCLLVHLKYIYLKTTFSWNKGGVINRVQKAAHLAYTHFLLPKGCCQIEKEISLYNTDANFNFI